MRIITATSSDIYNSMGCTTGGSISVKSGNVIAQTITAIPKQQKYGGSTQ